MKLTLVDDSRDYYSEMAGGLPSTWHGFKPRDSGARYANMYCVYDLVQTESAMDFGESNPTDPHHTEPHID